jgi:hypothetical protein
MLSNANILYSLPNFVDLAAKTESLGARGVPFREVYSLPEVFLLRLGRQGVKSRIILY